MKTISAIICIFLMNAPVFATTGYIKGIIKSCDDGNFVITGVDYYKHKVDGKQETGDQKIPKKGKPVYILDGRIASKEDTLKVGRQCFVFWNRSEQQMVVALTGTDEENPNEEPKLGPKPTGRYLHTTEGIIKSATTDGMVLIVSDQDGDEAEKSIKFNSKTNFLLDTKYGSTFEEVCVVGKRVVAFCYRNRTFPNWVAGYSESEDENK